jgi:hypothetical protein
MGLSAIQKEMLFILGQVLSKTSRRFSKAYLEISIMKAEFIDVIRGIKAVAKKERAIYRNLAQLEKGRYIDYDKRDLRFTKKGFKEYEKIRADLMRFKQIEANIATQKIAFKRKIQAKLR